MAQLPDERDSMQGDSTYGYSDSEEQTYAQNYGTPVTRYQAGAANTRRSAAIPASAMPYADMPKERPQSALSILLWGDRNTRRSREAQRRANANALEPEWMQAFRVLWLAALVLLVNTGTNYSIWLAVLSFGWLAASSWNQNRRPSSKLPLTATPRAAWLLLIGLYFTYGITVFAPGYVWRLPALATYCLLNLWLISNGGYTRQKPDPAAAAKAQNRWLGAVGALAIITLVIGLIFVMNTILPFIIYCVVGLALIIALRPKPEQPTNDAGELPNIR